MACGAGFGRYNPVLTGARDVGNDVQVFVELNSDTERPAVLIAAQERQIRKLGKTQILKKHDVAFLWRPELFGLGNGIPGPVQIHAAQVGFFSGQGHRSFFGLVADVEIAFRVHVRDRGIDGSKSEETSSLHHSIPAEWIDHVWIGRSSDGISALITARLKRIYRPAMFVIAHAPDDDDGCQRYRRRQPSSRTTRTSSDFGVNQREQS